MIQIIDGFNLPTETPIDSRIVVADATKRLGISSKYHGLRVWEQDTDTPYYWDGSTWVSELDLVVTGVDGNVTDGKIPKFTSINPTKIEDSQISDDGSTVTIDGILDVTGNLTFGGNLNGDIDAANITTGFLNLDRLDKGSGIADDVLQIDATGVPKFVSLSGISIGSSSTSNAVKLNNVNNSLYYRFILREEGTTALGGGNSFGLFSYETNLWISQESTQTCILAHGGSKTNPPYSFYDTASTSKEILGGMYYNVDKLVFSKQNSSGNLVNSLVIDNDAVTFGESANFSPRIRTHDNPTDPNFPSYTWWGNDETGMYRPDDNVIGFSIDGVTQLKIKDDGLHIKTSQYDNPDADKNPIVFNNINSIGVPIGGIIIWSGVISDIGTGNLWNFAVCDGTLAPPKRTNPDGIDVDTAWNGVDLPDLKERFALGAGNGSYTPGTLKGSKYVTLSDDNIPPHTHSSGTLNITSSGKHEHAIADDHSEVGTTFDSFRQGKDDRGGESTTKSNIPGLDGTHIHSAVDFGGDTGGWGGDSENVDNAPSSFMIEPLCLVVVYIIRLV